MKKILLLLFSLFSLNIFSQEWQWAKSASGTATEVAQLSTVDTAGNLYVIGSFETNTIYFDSILIINPGPSSCNFLVKYDMNGNAIWAKAFKLNNYGNSINSMCHDQAGNIFFAGTFYHDSVTFGNYVLRNDSANDAKMFIVKMKADGDVVWAIQADKQSEQYISSISSDAAGNVYAIGGFKGSQAIFGSDTLSGSAGWAQNQFHLKVSPNGSFSWAKKIEGSLSPTSSWYFGFSEITSDDYGNTYLAGHFRDTVLIIEGDTLLNSSYASQTFVLKYDPSGNFQWSANIAPSYRYITDIHCDAAGQIYLTGTFNIPSITIGTSVLTGCGTTQYSELYLAKLDQNGNILWARTPDGNHCDHQPAMLQTDNNSNVYLAGNYDGYIRFGNDTLRALDPPPHSKFFVAGFDPSGTPLFAKGVGAESYDIVSSLSIDKMNNLYVTGGFNSDSVKFDGMTLINSYFEDEFQNLSDIFVAKLDLNNVSITEYGDLSHLKIFPNPSSCGLINIESNLGPDCKCRVSNMLGQTIVNKTISQHDILDLSGLDKGVYFIELTNRKNDRVIQKVILQ
jgi:hypothetical protein